MRGLLSILSFRFLLLRKSLLSSCYIPFQFYLLDSDEAEIEAEIMNTHFQFYLLDSKDMIPLYDRGVRR